MRASRMEQQKRIAAGVMGLLLLAVLLFAAFYIAMEAEHECSGENCPICACMRLCEQVLTRTVF